MKPTYRLLIYTGLLFPATALADLVSQDAFSAYTIGAELPSQNPTIPGYVGPWTDVAFGDAEPAVSAGSLTYGGANYTPGVGNKVGKSADLVGINGANSGRVERLLDSSLTVTNATTGTVYLSWLFQTGNENAAPNANTYQTLALFNGNGADDGFRKFDAGIAAGDFGTPNYAFRVDNNTPANLGVSPDSNVHLIVAKFVLSDAAASDSVTVWIDPALGAGEPTGGVTISGRDIAFDRLVFSDYASNSSNWDEVRWGTTFSNVTTDPVFPAVPSFELQPQNFYGDFGDIVTLQSGAISSPTPTYQWQKSMDGINDWTNLVGETSALLNIPSAAYSTNGFYRVIATNANGSTPSDVVEVNLVFPAPVIQVQPASLAAEQGSTAVLSVTATGLGTLSYQWFKDSDPIPTATSATLTLSNVQESDEGAYSVTVTDDAATAESLPETSIDSFVVTLQVFPAWNGLVSHDPFDPTAGYGAGSLATQNPAIAGYIGPWAITEGFGPVSPVISSGSLAYSNPLYLGSSGDRVGTPADATGISGENAGRVARPLGPELVVGDTTTGTRYVSWLFRSGVENAAPDAQVYQTLAFFDGPVGNDANRDFDAGIAAGDFGTTNFAFRLGNSGALVGNLGVPSDGGVHLFVAKFVLGDTPGSDSATVWIDPVLGSGEPTGGVTVSGTDLRWDRIALSDYASNSSNWDEIRWGSTFNSVTLNPSPPNNFAVWIAGYDVGLLTGFEDDADGDGVKNGIENVFGTDPSVSTPGISEIAKSGNTVTFQHPQSAASASDVAVSYRWSTDLATFHASGVESGGTTITLNPALNTPTVGITTVTATVTGNQPPRLFLVMEANLSP